MAASAKAAATLTVLQPAFTPTTVTIGKGFAFSLNLKSSVAASNAIVAIDIRDQASENLLLQKYFSAQNFAAGQAHSYTWSGTIPTGATLSIPFTSGRYNVVIHLFNSNWTSQYTPSVVATTFVVTPAASTATTAAAKTPASTANLVYLPSAPNVGYTAVAPIRPPTGSGKTYYVSDPGNAAVNKLNRALLPPGSTVYPTIQAAAGLTQPGDTVLVMNGTYTANPASWVDGVLTVTRSGSAAGGYITYAAYPGAHPVISTAGDTNTWDDIAIEANYIVIRGFETIGSAKYVTLAYANQTTATEEAALRQEAAAGTGASLPSGTAKRLTNGNCIAGADVTHVIIANNLIHDCSGAGIDFEQSDYTNVEANTVYNTSWWTMYDTSGISLHLALNSDSSTAYKNFVLDNISYDNANTQPFDLDVYNNDIRPGSAPTAPTDGNGIIIDTNQSTNDHSPYLGRTLVAGNITYGNGGSGIHAFYSNHVDIINNTAYMNDTCPVAGSTCGPGMTSFNGAQISGINNGQIYAMSGSDVNIYNNILYAPSGKLLYSQWNDSKVAENDNIMYSANGKIVLQGYKSSPQDLLANPLFSNPSAPAQNNFLFAANSPGIDAGVSFSNDNISTPSLLGLSIRNGRVDIGADQ